MRNKLFAALTVLPLLLSIAAMGQFYKLQVSGAGVGLSTPLVEADVNHDGKLDIVGLSFHQGLYSLTALLGNGKGGFEAPQSTAITGIDNPRFPAVGDFNDDGNADVAFVGTDHVTGATVVGLMLGNGDGTFHPTRKVATIGQSNQNEGPVITGDFNGDGNTDIAVTGGTTVTVLLGKGDGTFLRAKTSPGTSSSCIAAGDFNNDGKLDLTVGSAVMLGNGDGTFQSPLAVPSGGCSVAVADVNGDGDLDLITGGAFPTGGNDIRVHLGNGTGKFGASTAYQTGKSAGFGIAVGDFNGDGKPDIAVTNNRSEDVTILLNIGKGKFHNERTFNQGSLDVLAGDFNGDHKLDLLINTRNGVSIMAGNGDGTFQANLAQNFQLNAQLHSADVNGDGKLDLVAYNPCCGAAGAHVELGKGDGSFGAPIPFPSSCVGGSVAIGDFNHDGKIDVATTSGMGVNVCFGNGDGTFQNAVIYDQSIQHQAVMSGDFNNDGNLDLAVSDQAGISILLNKGDGTFGAAIATGLDATFPTFILGDFNKDGKLDVAAITSSGITVLPGKGNGKFGNPIVSTAPQGVTLLVAGDLNKDGKLDLVTSNFSNLAHNISVLLGNGDGTFQSPVDYAAFAPQELVLGDINGDGNLDVAVAAHSTFLQVFFGKGDGTLSAAKDFITTGGPTGITTGDFTGDGDLDLAVLNYNEKKLVVFLNLK